jgi:hypothetical protein
MGKPLLGACFADKKGRLPSGLWLHMAPKCIATVERPGDVASPEAAALGLIWGSDDGRARIMGRRLSLTVAAEEGSVSEPDGSSLGYDGAGTPTHLRLRLPSRAGATEQVSEASVTTPQSLRNVLQDPLIASILRAHRERIFGALTAEDNTGEGSLHVDTFRRVLVDLGIGFQAYHVEDLVQSLQFLGRLEREGSPQLPSIQEGHNDPLQLLTDADFKQMVPYSHLFSNVSDIATVEEQAAAAMVVQMMEEGGDDASEEQGGEAAEAGEAFTAATERGLVTAAAAAAVQELGGEPDDDKVTPLPRALPIAPGAIPGAVVGYDSPHPPLPTPTAARSRGWRRQQQRAPMAPPPPSPNEPSDGASGVGAKIQAFKRTQSGYDEALKRRAHAARRFRLPSVEDLIDHAAPAGLAASNVRASMPELLAEANISVNLNAYSSIGVIAVFFTSLSITVMASLLAADLEETFLTTGGMICHSLVVVLDVFCVLTMSMVYYYGQLHIGHGFSETAERFVGSRERPVSFRLCGLS